MNLNLIIGLVLTFLGVVSLVQTLRLFFTPLKKIGLAQGNSTIFGTVVSEESLLSPITKIPCVYCAYRTFERGAKFRSGTTLPKSRPRGVAQVLAGTGVKHSPFYVEDDSGKILVQDKAQLFGSPKKQITVYDDTQEYLSNIQEFKSVTQIGEGEDRQYEEDLIIPGDEIFIHGIIKIENGQKVMYPDAFSFSSIRKLGSSPMGIIVTIILLYFGVKFLLDFFV